MKQNQAMSVLMKCQHHLKTAKRKTGQVTEFRCSLCIHIFGKMISKNLKQLQSRVAIWGYSIPDFTKLG